MFDLTYAESLARQYYRLEAKAKALPGEIDLNFRLREKEGLEYILKIAGPAEKAEMLELQNAVLEHLAHQNVEGLQLPRLIQSTEGKAITELDQHHSKRLMRLLSWVPGQLWAAVKPHSPQLLRSLGAACAKLCGAMQGFEHPAAHRWYKWDLAKADWIEAYLHHFAAEEQRIVGDFLHQFKQRVLPQISQLRHSVNHNDANDFNILVDTKAQKVVGLIDFGDVLYTPTINDLAITIAYAAMHKADPLRAAMSVVEGFHEGFPLLEEELALIYTLVAARLCTTVTVAAINKAKEPENAYLQISEQAAWDLLHKWKAISPQYAYYAFRQACGWPPNPHTSDILDYLAQQSFAPIMGIDLAKHQGHYLDLSVGSLELGNNPNFEDTQLFDRLISDRLRDTAADYGIGAYDEVRPLYTTDAYAQIGNEGPEWRTIHLGLDVFMPAGQPVYSPLEGMVYSIQDNAMDRDYGPTIILEHQTDKGLPFYSLYGHLDKGCLDQLKTGDWVAKGQEIALLGAVHENGGWPPHLHLQLITDILGQKGNFPGVANPALGSLWRSLCPDPSLLLALAPQKELSLTTAQLLQRRKEHLGPNLSLSYR
ncbi:MAG: phosphotransferase, partial [Bacteroidota bacterium]